MLGEQSRVWAIVYLAVVLVGMFDSPPTMHAKLAHRRMVRKTSFRAGLVVALAAIGYPPLVLVAFVLLDWAFVEAGQEVPLS